MEGLIQRWEGQQRSGWRWGTKQGLMNAGEGRAEAVYHGRWREGGE